MGRLDNMNPFVKHDTHSPRAVVAYKVLSIATWLLAVVASAYYHFAAPAGGDTIWHINRMYPSGFTLNWITTDVYFLVLFVLQVGYVAHLFSSAVERVNPACWVGSHFVLHNLLHFAFVMLFARHHFVWAEIVLLVDFCNLSGLYFRHNSYPRFIHWPAVSGPLAWTFVAIYWNGAIMVPHANSLVARIFANIFVWGIMAYGLFFIFLYKDYTMGFNLSVLAASLGVAQFFRQVVAFQWIFAFTIMAVLFVFTVLVAVPAWSGKEVFWSRKSGDAPAESEPERAPLLGDNAA